MDEIYTLAEKHLADRDLPSDDESLLAYNGPAVEVTNAVALLLKKRFTIRSAFTAYRRMRSLQIADEYKGENLDRANFSYAISSLHNKVESILQEQNDDFGKNPEQKRGVVDSVRAFISEEFQFRFRHLEMLQSEEADLNLPILSEKCQSSEINGTDSNVTLESAKTRKRSGNAIDQGKSGQQTRSSTRKRSQKRISSPSPELQRSQSVRSRRSSRSSRFSRTNRESRIIAHDESQTPAYSYSSPHNNSTDQFVSPSSSFELSHNGKKSVHVMAGDSVMPDPSSSESVVASNRETTAAPTRRQSQKRILQSKRRVSVASSPKKRRNSSTSNIQDQVREASESAVHKILQMLSTEGMWTSDSQVQLSKRCKVDRSVTSEKSAVVQLKTGIISPQGAHDTSNEYELEKRVSELLSVISKLEEAKRDCETELRSAIRQLSNAKAEIKRLNDLNAELSKQEVAIKRNGEYTDELKACLCHLKKAGVPDTKCGEVIISVGVLLGRRVVADDSND
ncbi:unnamed protein product [Anisakis simplex]|uniref:Centrosomal protein of 44 kDa n=1 Tax=Anisakis simplex TaxID=6269 RepID=A0A0M3JUB9_ANISI|nr:unnamed protein product [Anisakis simplex]